MDAEQTNIFDSKALPLLLQLEGGWSSNKHDSGGDTMEGVTQETYNMYRNIRGEFLQSVRQITFEEVRDLYYQFYWLPSKASVLPYPLNVALFVQYVQNEREAIKILQRLVDADDDGLPGPKTVNAVHPHIMTTDAVIELTTSYLKQWLLYYAQIGTGEKSVFLRGWDNRIYAIAKALNLSVS